MQSLVLQADQAYIKWSSELHMLSLFSAERSDVLDNSSNAGDADGHVHKDEDTVRVMDPLKRTVAVVPEQLALEKGGTWYDCCWTRCGRLLSFATVRHLLQVATSIS